MAKQTSMADIFTAVVEFQYVKKKKRNIWDDSEWKHISELENDDVGKVGENMIQKCCEEAKILSNIDGSKTKDQNSGIGGKGDGTINGKCVEIKTARLGSTGSSFQHELGECPWNADYMLFVDISPRDIYITLFKNWSEEFYKKSGQLNGPRCDPYFPTKKICWRKKKGAFKFDTTIKINNESKNTFKLNSSNPEWKDGFAKFINQIILP
jgi:hypothetical protein